MGVAAEMVVECTAEYEKIDAALDAVVKKAQDAGQAADQAFSGAADGARTQGFKARLAGIAEAGVGLAVVFSGKVAAGLRGFTGLLARGLTGLLSFAGVGLSMVGAGLHRFAESTRDANGHLSLTGKAAEGGARALKLYGYYVMIVTGVVTGLTLGLAALVIKFGEVAGAEAAKVTPSWNRVRTILGGSVAQFADVRKEVGDLADSLGVDAVQANNAFYQVLSAMPTLVSQPKRALDVLRAAMEATATGFTDGETAVKAITGILNAFGLQAEDARRVSDALFAAQNQGSITFGEVAESIGTVAPLVAGLGLEFEDLLGIIATLTPQNISASEGFTQIRAAVQNIVKPSEEAKAAAIEMAPAFERAGITFDAAGLKAAGLNGFLLKMVEVTKGDPAILTRFFGSEEAVSLMTNLATHTQDLRDKTEGIRQTAGETGKALDTMNESWERQKQILSAQLHGTLRNIGYDFEEVGTVGLQAMNGLLKAVYDLNAAGEKLDQRWSQMEWEKIQGVLSWLDQHTQGAGIIGMPMFGTWGSPAPRRDPGQTGSTREWKPAPPRASVVEPTTIEYAKRKIDEYRQAQEAAAAAELVHTGNTKKYDEALRATNVAVNKLIVSEMERLKKAGVGVAAINQLGSLVHVNRDPAGDRNRADNATRELETLARQLTIVRSFNNAQGTPFRALEEMPERLKAAVGDAMRIDDEIRKTEELMRRGGRSPAMESYLASLRDAKKDALELAKTTRDTMASRDELLPERVVNARNQLKDLSDTFGQLGRIGINAFGEIPPAIAPIVDRFNALTQQVDEFDRLLVEAGTHAPAQAVAMRNALARERAEMAKNVDVLAVMRQHLQDVASFGEDLFKGLNAGQVKTVADELSAFGDATTKVKNAERELELARARRQQDPARYRRAVRDQANATRDLQDRTNALTRALEDAGIHGEALDRIMAGIQTTLQGVGAAVTDQNRHWSEMADHLGKIAAGASDFAATVQGMDYMPSRLKKIADGFAEIANGAKDFATAMATQDYVGAALAAVRTITGVVHTVKGIFGESEQAKALHEAQHQDSVDLIMALRDLRKAILDQVSSAQVAKDQDAAQRAATALARDPNLHRDSDPAARRKALADLAVSMGLAQAGDEKGVKLAALTQWAAQLDQRYGLNGALEKAIENSDPESLLRALQGLPSALGDAAAKMGQFGNDSAGVIARVAWQMRVLGKTDPSAVLKETVAQMQAAGLSLGDFGTDLQNLASLDLTTEAGRAQRDAIVASLVARSTAGGANFGDLTPQQLRDLIDSIAQAGGDAAATAADGGSTNSFQVSRTITEAGEDRLVGQLSTSNYWLEIIGRTVTTMAGQPLPVMPAPSIPAAAPAPSTSVTVTLGPGALQVTVPVTIAAPAAAPSTPGGSGYEQAGMRIGTGALDELSRGLRRVVDDATRFRGR